MSGRKLALSFLLLLLVACASGPPLTEPRPRVAGWNPITHEVRAGDTLYSIAWWYQVDYREIARWNQLVPPYEIAPGQNLRVKSPPVFHPDRNRRHASAASKPPPDGRIVSSQQVTAKRQPLLHHDAQISTWVWPTEGQLIRQFNLDSGGTSKGIDIEGEFGQSVRAVAPGVVVYSGNALKGYGNLVIIKHNQSLLSAYAHNQRVYVSEGEHVDQGAKIAEMGRKNEGQSLLHFEIRKDGDPIDPLSLLPNRG
ncbi:MAG TPA: peptidase M23 [Gammaproteobacteria bacterium]|nr:peptidase M23 [Gammaproteobacteria bacterium]